MPDASEILQNPDNVAAIMRALGQAKNGEIVDLVRRRRTTHAEVFYPAHSNEAHDAE